MLKKRRGFRKEKERTEDPDIFAFWYDGASTEIPRKLVVASLDAIPAEKTEEQAIVEVEMVQKGVFQVVRGHKEDGDEEQMGIEVAIGCMMI